MKIRKYFLAILSFSFVITANIFLDINNQEQTIVEYIKKGKRKIFA